MEIKGDFLGFSFNGVRSEELGIVRTSDGDNFTENLQPEIKDVTAEVPGMHGAYYFGSTFGVKNISVSFAFDDLTELQFRKLRQVFGQRKQGELIFDERPYKKYIAKIESPIELSYVCFDRQKREADENGRSGIRIIDRIVDEETGETTLTYETVYPWIYDFNEDGTPKTERIYKGDGKIEFVCYFPFAKSVYKTLPDGEETSDWVESSGILTQELYDEYGLDTVEDLEGENQYEITVFNPGDLETGFRLYCPFTTSSISISLQYVKEVGEEKEILGTLNITDCTQKGDDVGIMINTDNCLIQGVSVAPHEESEGSGNYIWTTSSNIYNGAVTSGTFFKIEPEINFTDYKILITGDKPTQIFYDYLYF